MLFHKAFSRMARIQCEGIGVLIVVSGLTDTARYATIKMITVAKLGETGNTVRAGLV
jgi:hypothetical protein